MSRIRAGLNLAAGVAVRVSRSTLSRSSEARSSRSRSSSLGILPWGAASGDYELSYACLPTCAKTRSTLAGESLSVTPELQSITTHLDPDSAVAYVVDVARAGGVSLSLCAGSADDLDTQLRIFDADANLVASNDDDCGALSALELCLDVGPYLAVVTSLDSTSGTMQLDDIGPRSCDDRCTHLAGTLVPERGFQTVRGELDAAMEHAYEFEIVEESIFTATFCEANGSADFDTHLCLTANDGSLEILAGDAAATSRSSPCCSSRARIAWP